MKKRITDRRRVLARILAEDLRHVELGSALGGADGGTTQVTQIDPDSSRRDITNVGGDGDVV